jgi:hypothetical protein
MEISRILSGKIAKRHLTSHIGMLNLTPELKQLSDEASAKARLLMSSLLSFTSLICQSSTSPVIHKIQRLCFLNHIDNQYFRWDKANDHLERW